MLLKAPMSKGKSPIPVLENYHGRIVSHHPKDRNADGGNVLCCRA
jgi:hypothetical protein